MVFFRRSADKKGATAKKNQPLFVIEAMKMKTTVAGAMVNTGDLVLVLE